MENKNINNNVLATKGTMTWEQDMINGRHNLQQTANVSGTAGTSLNGYRTALQTLASATRFRRLLAVL